LSLREGRIIKEGFDEELDELIHIQRDGRGIIAGVENRERERTGIPSLKVGYNRVFGYYIEVSKAHADKVPDDYIRKQTLVSAERYITPELKEIESKILSAKESRLQLEYELFQNIRNIVAEAGHRIQDTAAFVAVADVILALAEVADRYGYCRPEVNTGTDIIFEKLRHPVVERTGTDSFVPNDIRLDHKDSTLVIVTGPNMAGKSTVLRQTALAVLMAHAGSYVPADRAVTGICDRIFSRVGATDYLARGQSTFMVEMSETASILHNSTKYSLVILDEIGRGTSTYDGLSIAWAVADYLVNKDGCGIRTLFATHYHELTDIAKEYGCVKNKHMMVKEWDGNIEFLRVLGDGPASKSYGIHVAALAGVPEPVIKHAYKLLKEIEEAHEFAIPGRKKDKKVSGHGVIMQHVLPLVVDRSSAIRKKIMEADLDNMTPFQALSLLYELKMELEDKKQDNGR
jgi:DNA mismatch repair protein MutS